MILPSPTGNRHPLKASWLLAMVLSLLVLPAGCISGPTGGTALNPELSSPVPAVTGSASPSGPAGDSTIPPSIPGNDSGATDEISSIPAERADIVLIGSELEGMYLARAAADEGLTVRVLDPMAQPGGQLLQAEMLFLDAVMDDSGKGKLIAQGRFKDLMTGFRSGKIRKHSEFTAYYNQLTDGIPILSGIRIEAVDHEPGWNNLPKIVSVTYRDQNGSLRKMEADYWVENTDHAALVSKLGVDRQPGLEAFYGLPGIEYMSAGYMMKFKNVDWAAFQKHGYATVNDSYAVGVVSVTNKFEASNDRVMLRGLNAVNQRDGEVLINALLVYQIDPANEASVAEGLELGKKETERVLAHFKKHMAGWKNAELNGFPNHLYIREYNHYYTDYILQVSDVLGGRMFYDNVSIAGYPLDLQGVMAVKWGIEMGRPDKYGMPLRSFLLRDYENVILAGKNVGATAIAYGSARIQQNTSIAAEAIGAIIGHLNGSKKLKELQPEDWPALHDYLQRNYNLKLTGVTAKNKITGWTAEEIERLNTGKIIYANFERTGKK